MSRFGDLLAGAASPSPAVPEPPKVEIVEVQESIELVVELPEFVVEEEVVEPVAEEVVEQPKTNGKSFRGRKRKKS